MKDGAVKACFSMGMILGTYTVFMLSHVAAGIPPPDGVLFTSVVIPIAVLGGYAYGRKGT
jgi:hypothetical protein